MYTVLARRGEESWARRLAKQSGKVLKMGVYPSPQGIAIADKLIQAIQGRPVASIALVLVLGQVEVSIPLGNTSEGSPPWTEDRPFCLGRITVGSI
jgi:hypothetical protein